MTGPRLAAEIDDTILVEFSHFALQEIPMARIAQGLGIPGEGRRSAGGPGGIIFASQASDHYPSVRIELWSAEPAPSTDRWDATEELRTNLAGSVRLKSLAHEMSDKTLPLPQSGDYGARVHVRDDPNIDELDTGSFADTNEHWLVQLWFIGGQPE